MSVGVTTTGVTLTLGSTVTVSGTVEATGTPVGGALVRSTGPGKSSPVTTASDGSYTLSGLAAGTQTLVVTTPRGTHPPDLATIAPSSGQSLTKNFTLAAYGSITVTVRSTLGAAIPGAAVLLIPADPGQDPRQLAPTSRATDATGIATFSTIDPGAYDVNVLGSTTGEHLVVTQGHPKVTVTLTVPVATVVGTVLGPHGSHLAGARVQVDNDSGPVATTQTTANGTYNLRLTSPGTFTVEAFDGATLPPQAKTVNLTLGETSTEDFSSGTASLQVTVKATGTPVTGALVTLSIGTAPPGSPSALAVTASDGLATFATVVPGTYTVGVAASGLADAVEHTVVVSAGSNTTALTLSGGDRWPGPSPTGLDRWPTPPSVSRRTPSRPRRRPRQTVSTR